MSTLGVDYDATVAWLGRRHGGDWDRVAHSFTAFLHFAATLGGDEAAALRHVDPLQFTPHILESRAAYQNWRESEAKQERAQRRRSARPARKTVGDTGDGILEEHEDSIFGGKAKPSGFSVLTDSIADKVEDIHAKVRTMLPSIDDEGNEDDDDDSDGSAPEVFFSNYDWSKIRLPGDPGWDDTTDGFKSPVKSPPAPPAPAPKITPPTEPKPTVPAPGSQTRQPFGVLPRGFFDRPFKRPSECDGEDEDASPDEDALMRFEKLERSLGVTQNGNPQRPLRKEIPSPFDAVAELNRALEDHGVTEEDLDAASKRIVPNTRRWEVVNGEDDSDDEIQPPAKPIHSIEAREPRQQVSAPQRPGRWQVVEHSDDSDDDEPCSGKGKGKGKGKGGKGVKGPCAP